MGRGLAVVVGLLSSVAIAGAADAPDPATAAVQERERAFWKSYNDCAVADMPALIAADVEFYHDRGGITRGRDALVESVRKNLCSNPDFRIRREEVPGTVRVFPLAKEGVVYGAIAAGEHTFDIVEKGKAPVRDGLARFTTLWLLQDGAWRMSRVLSYDHGPAKR
ncbi:MAG: nuclear transport factor 2 family protein [Vicinamibacteria bacterium]